MIRLALPLLILLPACAPAAQTQDHDASRKTDAAVIDALNQPGGPDYAAAVGVVEKSGRPALQQDYDIGNLILKACRENRPYCAAPNDASAGVARLARVASTPGEDAAIAAGDLAAYYKSGAGPSLPADPALAACWGKVRAGSGSAAACAR